MELIHAVLRDPVSTEHGHDLGQSQRNESITGCQRRETLGWDIFWRMRTSRLMSCGAFVRFAILEMALTAIQSSSAPGSTVGAYEGRPGSLRTRLTAEWLPSASGKDVER